MHESRLTPPCKTTFPSPGRVLGNSGRVCKNDIFLLSVLQLDIWYALSCVIDQIVSDLFAFRCQKCSICKLKLYAGGEYKILHDQFFDGNTIQKSFSFFFFSSKRERSEIVGLEIFHSNSQVSIIFITDI